jgi:hypothetical protein
MSMDRYENGIDSDAKAADSRAKKALNRDANGSRSRGTGRGSYAAEMFELRRLSRSTA